MSNNTHEPVNPLRHRIARYMMNRRAAYRGMMENDEELSVIERNNAVRFDTIQAHAYPCSIDDLSSE